MPYVQRSDSGQIVAIFETRQPNIAEEFLPDDHLEVLAFQPETAEKTAERRLVAELKRQSDEIREGIIAVTFAWSAVESSMAMVLHNILDDEDGGIASAIYFSPGSSDVRFKLVDAAMCELLGETKLKPDDFDILIAPWRELMRQLNSSKTVRNKVAHGAISTVHMFKKNYARLRSAISETSLSISSIILGRRSIARR